MCLLEEEKQMPTITVEQRLESDRVIAKILGGVQELLSKQSKELEQLRVKNATLIKENNVLRKKSGYNLVGKGSRETS